jgi:hypothetical protein
MATSPTDYIDKLRAHGYDLAIGTTKEPPTGEWHIPAGSVFIADTVLDSIGYVRRECLADLVCLILNDPLADDEAALAHIRGATGL